MSAVDNTTIPDYSKTNSTVNKREEQNKADEATAKVTNKIYIKLNTTQLTNQDPLNPMEDIDFTGQLAQLQALEEQMAMTKTMQAMRVDTQLQAGTAMIGKYIDGIDNAGAEAKGLVTRVVQNSDGVFVELGNSQMVEVSNINNVWNDAASMNNDIVSSGYAINMWVEAGLDAAQQPVNGIVEKVQMVNGQVVLSLYGGKQVTWDQVTEMRNPTEEELWYTLPDEVREKVEKAQKMVNKGVTGKDDNGNMISGIVGGAELDGDKVYLLLYTPGDMENPNRINIDKLEGNPRTPTAADAAQSLNGLWVTGLDKDSKSLSGIVVGAVENNDGMALILDSGEHVYFDTVKEVREAKELEYNRLDGMFVEATSTSGEEAAGVILKKLEVNGKQAFLLHTGEIVLCETVTASREATADEKKAAEDAAAALED